MTELSKLTYPEAGELLGKQTVALIPIGSTEPHGPHLPLDTDVTIACAQAQRTAKRLEADGVRTVLMPAMPYGVTNYTSGFAGRITLRPGTLWALVEDLVTSLEQQGVLRIVLVNGHLEPAHVKVLRGVCVDHPKVGHEAAHVILADNTRRRWAATLGREFQSGDCHAGSYESSIVLAADPGAVREVERQALPEVRVNLIEKMRAGVSSFQDAGATSAYCGAPAEASAAEGEQLIDRLADMTYQCARETWPELFA